MCMFRGLFVAIILFCWTAPVSAAELPDGTVVKPALDTGQTGENLLKPDRWRPWQKGFQRDGGQFVCNNGPDIDAQRGASQSVVLNQTKPEPIVATLSCRTKNVGGSPDNDFSLYLDLVYTDGTSLWGQTAPIDVGTHDWQRRRVVVMPEKPIRSLSFNMLLRKHSGEARFRNPELRVIKTPAGAVRFDGVCVIRKAAPGRGFQVRDVAAGSGFVKIDRQALGLKLQWSQSQQAGATFIDATLSDTTGKDRAVTLVYAIPVKRAGLRWLADCRREEAVEPKRDYAGVSRFRVGNGRLSRYPLAAVAQAEGGTALGIDMARPAFYRVGYNSATEELYLAYDIGLAPEKPSATVRFCHYKFEPEWGFRAALAEFYKIFPEQFRCRTPEQGVWMPFAKISEVRGWEDFGFKFKEGNNEMKWDDAHDIVTFRYTEPMTWWMRMPKEMPRTMESALAESRRLADNRDKRALALRTSGYHNEQGQFPARLRDTPWCDGAVWSMNTMPRIQGEVTSFKNRWNPTLKEQLYGPKRKGDLDGEYIDSSEGYVTDELDFRRDHFAAADTPLCFSPDSHRPAIFRGLVALEYARALARDVHEMGKLMMANSTPIRLCWLAPQLEVMGTETNWHREGKWRPMSDSDLLFRRAMCKGKPYCFLMNTNFDEFSHELVERFMKRSLAYGMFPGFFSHNASEGHYFTRPDLYNRDRPLFKRYVPLSKLVAEAGWEPITLARSDDEKVYVERFGTRYLTVFNDSLQQRTVTITLQTPPPAASRELPGGRPVQWQDGRAKLTLAGEDVALIELQ